MSPLFPAIAAAICIGLAQMFFLIYFWGYIGAHSPLPAWLASMGVTGMPWRVIIFCTDYLLNVLLSLPAAFLLLQLRPQRLILFVIVAVIPAFLWQSRLVFLGEVPSEVSILVFVPGWFTELTVLAVAVLVIQWVRSRKNLTMR